MRAGAPPAKKPGGTLSNDLAMAGFSGDASRAAATEPSGGNDDVVPSWDRVIPPASAVATRVAYCRDHWPPL
ncbi:hypothetical protein GCM10009825_36910 [Arthrobacter humicola]|uniref:Uncharacterized protein n=1 Tax=Arthrobacter humicola TaxID=409291 RepID=A0ABN2ZNF3_9MICC